MIAGGPIAASAIAGASGRRAEPIVLRVGADARVVRAAGGARVVVAK